MKHTIKFSHKIMRFPGVGGWMYVPIPKKHRQLLGSGPWGMQAVTVTLGSTSWKIKVMQSKQAGPFVAIKASVMKKDNVAVGSLVSVSLVIS